jgi:hypothetical protein
MKRNAAVGRLTSPSTLAACERWFATTLGPHLTGLVSPFPIYALILAAFAHHLDGSLSAITVLKGLRLGLFSCAGFFAVVAFLGSIMFLPKLKRKKETSIGVFWSADFFHRSA